MPFVDMQQYQSMRLSLHRYHTLQQCQIQLRERGTVGHRVSHPCERGARGWGCTTASRETSSASSGLDLTGDAHREPRGGRHDATIDDRMEGAASLLLCSEGLVLPRKLLRRRSPPSRRPRRVEPPLQVGNLGCCCRRGERARRPTASCCADSTALLWGPFLTRLPAWAGQWRLAVDSSASRCRTLGASEHPPSSSGVPSTPADRAGAISRHSASLNISWSEAGNVAVLCPLGVTTGASGLGGAAPPRSQRSTIFRSRSS